MIAGARRRLSVYGAFASAVPKVFLAYSMWAWMQFIVQVIAIVILVSIWTAVYANRADIAGLDLQQTINYAILAQIFLPLIGATSVIYAFGDLLRSGQMAVVLLRPVDFQAANFVTAMSEIAVSLVLQIPLAIVAWLLYRYDLPTDPAIWAAFLLTLVLGSAVLFCFDYIIACLAFYSTEIWGLSVFRFAVATFLSGSLVPLVMMPERMRTLVALTPFAQALYVPVSLLSGITPLSDMPRIWLLQTGYLVVLLVLSRFVFNVAVRKVTIQGG